jgi:OOP family OmpA-OmpF porin
MKSVSKAVFFRRLRVGEMALILTASVLSLSPTTAAFAQDGGLSRPPHPMKIGNVYQPVPAAPPDLAQIIYFRGTPSSGEKGAAHVYVNGQLEGALTPDGYTRLCLKKGTYSIEAYIGDAPLYAGKANPKTEIDLEAGKTYFVGVSESGTGEPVPYRRADAERLLKGSHEDINIINRASAVVDCGNQSEAPQKIVPVVQTLLKFQLDAAVLFDFGKGDPSAITSAGRADLRRIAAKIRELPSDTVKRVLVLGHADPIGSEESNLQLSKARARTVSQVLALEGIPPGLTDAEGLGSSQPAVHCSPVGDMTKRIRCNAPNRRVEINVEGIKPDEMSNR